MTAYTLLNLRLATGLIPTAMAPVPDRLHKT